MYKHFYFNTWLKPVSPPYVRVWNRGIPDVQTHGRVRGNRSVLNKYRRDTGTSREIAISTRTPPSGHGLRPVIYGGRGESREPYAISARGGRSAFESDIVFAFVPSENCASQWNPFREPGGFRRDARDSIYFYKLNMHGPDGSAPRVLLRRRFSAFPDDLPTGFFLSRTENPVTSRRSRFQSTSRRTLFAADRGQSWRSRAHGGTRTWR